MLSWIGRKKRIEQHSHHQEDTLLEAESVTFAADAMRILDAVSVTSAAGEFIGLVGPNGAGKTTLLKCISGLLAHNHGTVHLEGRDLTRMSPRDIAKVVAHLPQNTTIDFGFTSLEVVLMGRNPHLGPFQLEGTRDYEVARGGMKYTDTEDLSSREINTLSGGERQRVLMARALAQEPRLLLLDEPTANLDIQHQLQVMDLVRSLVDDGLAAVTAMHDLNMASAYCDRIYAMSGGTVVASGTPAEVLVPSMIRKVFGVNVAINHDSHTGRPHLDFFLDDSKSRNGKRGRPASP
jgi:iron complex transport system ATP-binding protein